MKILHFFLITAVATMVISASGVSTASASTMPKPPAKSYCVAISPRKNTGFLHSCGYTLSECSRYKPGILAKYKKANPRFKKTTVASCVVAP